MTLDSFAFILHPLDPKADVARKYPTLARILPVGMIHFLSLYWPPLVLAHVRGVRSEATGKEVEGWLLACPLTARRMLQVPPQVAYRKIIQTGRLAERLGARILGLGAYTSVVGDGGLTVAQALQIPVTTGDSYTAALSVQALLEAAAQVGIVPERATAAVVGATGAIGGACAGLLAPRVRRLILVGRRAEVLREARQRLSALAAGPVEVTTDTAEVRAADLILTATSAGRPILFPEHLKPGAVVCDVARPRDVSPRVHQERDDVLVVDGGLVELPGRVSLGFNYGLPPGLTFGCIAETIALALEGRFEDYTVGKMLDLARVQEIEEIATRHGFRPAPLHSLDRPVPLERIQAVRARWA
ncbi:MAG: shikimate dehydrogenase [Anaerolineae bacterium]|nr:shikimate dehydrogenase [Anaerolineae bacterium]MDW7991263.1 shikimate dehydrogenase [Anaerolineae bacterium]